MKDTSPMRGMSTSDVHALDGTGMPSATRPLGRWKGLVWGGLLLLLAPLAVVMWPKKPAAASGASASDTPNFDGKALRFSRAFAERSGIKTEEVRKGPMTPVVQVVGAV